MKITSFCSPYNFKPASVSIKQNQKQNYEQPEFNVRLPLAKNYLAFTGGYSVNLKETVENLDNNAFPIGIKELAIKELEDGNKNDKTLIDIHKSKYGKINQMKSLDEVKENFPEFKDVLSDEEINYNSGSFIDDAKKGNLEWFDPDVDLTLQLLQMYWANGFSLTDLKEYTGGKNIFSAFDKLNIPRFNSTYGSVLKLSDKKYNERITNEMSRRLKESYAKKAEKEAGVYIPRGPLSEEHKKHISEGLINHYLENPEKLGEMSQRMKDYYERHPEEKEKLSKVLKKAWGLREAKSLRRKMSKFLSKKDISAEEFSEMNFNGANSLKAFWDETPWAKELWSKCMKIAWTIIKKQEARIQNFSAREITKHNDNEEIYEVKIYPDELKSDMKKWLRENGYVLERIPEKYYKAIITPSDSNYSSKEQQNENYKYSNEAISSYFDSLKDENLIANMYCVAIMKILNHAYEHNNYHNPVISRLTQVIGRGLPMSMQEICNLYANSVAAFHCMGMEKEAKRLESYLDGAYQLAKNQDLLELIKIRKRLRDNILSH